MKGEPLKGSPNLIRFVYPSGIPFCLFVVRLDTLSLLLVTVVDGRHASRSRRSLGGSCTVRLGRRERQVDVLVTALRSFNVVSRSVNVVTLVKLLDLVASKLGKLVGDECGAALREMGMRENDVDLSEFASGGLGAATRCQEIGRMQGFGRRTH